MVTIVLSQLSDALDSIGADFFEQGMAGWNTNMGQRSKGDRSLCARQLDGATDSTLITRVQHALDLQFLPRSDFSLSRMAWMKAFVGRAGMGRCTFIFRTNSIALA